MIINWDTIENVFFVIFQNKKKKKSHFTKSIISRFYEVIQCFQYDNNTLS